MAFFRLATALTVASATLLAPRISAACSCGGPGYPQAFAEAKWVFRGTAGATTKGETAFDVEGYYKGSGPPEVHVRGVGIGMCRRKFDDGATYVVFAKPDLNDGFCSATFKIRPEGERWGTPPEDAAKILESIGAVKLAPPVPGPVLHAAPERAEPDPFPPPSEPSSKAVPSPARAPAPSAAPTPPAPAAPAKDSPSCLGSIPAKEPGNVVPMLGVMGVLVLARRRGRHEPTRSG